MSILLNQVSPAADAALVAMIYDAALKPALWEHVLEQICKIANCSQAMLLAHHPAEAEITFFYGHGIEPNYLESFATRFAMVSPNGTKCFFNDLGEAQCSELFGDLSAFQNSAYYREWCAPQGIGRQCIMMLVRNEAKCGALIVSLRSSEDACANATIGVLNHYSDHLIRAIRIHNTLVEQAKAAEIARTTLDRINASVIMLDGLSNVLAFNNKAAKIPGISVGASVEKILTAVYGAGKVTEFVSSLTAANGNSDWHEVYLTPLQSAALPPHVLTFVKWRKSHDLPVGFVLGLNPAGMLTIHDLGAEKPARPEIFIKLFKLTPSESQVVTLLARGLKVSDIAVHQGVSISTTRSQIAAAMEKTGTRRQADLVRVAINAMLPTAFVTATD